MYHIWFYNDKLLYSLDQTEARTRSGVGWEDERRFKLSTYGSSFQSRFTMTEDVPSSTQYLECPSLCKVNFLTVCYKDLISCCQLQQKKRSSIRSPSTPTMFSVALLLLLAAGSCESH
ncbi:hypothetical protein F7725_003614 [Dissostichus mawsoni]|uniref:Uncharacterized protein n=1 Tax=Dissostichus mawsoni TaxID=36200 RepID=A0A7J5YAP2_DISMA|nr:hypothetical protein F7725_003614 [Dissostichus mawsoni]